LAKTAKHQYSRFKRYFSTNVARRKKNNTLALPFAVLRIILSIASRRDLACVWLCQIDQILRERATPGNGPGMAAASSTS